MDPNEMQAESPEKGSDLSEAPEIAAARHDQLVVLPGPRDLFIDIDSNRDWQILQERLESLAELKFHVEVVGVVESKSGMPRRHVYLRTTHELTPIERVAYQAVLGSDLKREFLSLMRIETMVERAPTVFFEAKDWVDPREPKRRSSRRAR